MTRPEKVSPPPSRSAYRLEDGTMTKKEIWRNEGSTVSLSWKEPKSYLHEHVRHDHYSQRADLRKLEFWVFFIPSRAHSLRVSGMVPQT